MDVTGLGCLYFSLSLARFFSASASIFLETGGFASSCLKGAGFFSARAKNALTSSSAGRSFAAASSFAFLFAQSINLSLAARIWLNSPVASSSPWV